VLLPGRANYLPNQTKPYHTVFDPCAVAIVNRICKDTDARLVIHSSWLRAKALIGQNTIPSVDCVKQHMINQGILPEYFHDNFEALWRFSGTRWTAINDWLYDNEVDTWVVLDDEFCPNKDYMLQAYNGGLFIQTDFDEGITVNHYYQILKHFQVNGARRN
jgi:hypothetical protein